MKVNSIEIDKFARPELTMGGSIELEDVGGNDILIRGENQSGKTHTFNALLYALLGETIALQRGHGNAVEIELTDDLSIFRGEAGKTVWTENEEFGPDTAQSEIRSRIGPRDLIHTHFLHSRLSELPLESLSPAKRVSRVLAATSDDLNERIEELEDQIDSLEDEKERKEAELNSRKRELQKRRRQKSELETQEEKWSTVKELAESGRLEEISDALQRDPELESRINDLTAEKQDLITNIRAKKNEKTRAEELEQETREIIIKALEEFICPVCEKRVSRGTANSRLDKKKCPFCNQSTDIDEAFGHLETEKERSDGKLEEIEEELEELKERKAEIESQIETLEEERPEIADLNSYAVRALRDYDHDIEEIHSKAKTKLEEAEEELENYSGKTEAIVSDVEDIKEKISNIEEEKQSKQDRIAELEEDAVATRISDFEDYGIVNINKSLHRSLRRFICGVKEKLCSSVKKAEAVNMIDEVI